MKSTKEDLDYYLQNKFTREILLEVFQEENPELEVDKKQFNKILRFIKSKIKK